MHDPGVDEPPARYGGNTVLTDKRWFESHHQGSVVAVTDATGAPITRYGYGPNGEPSALTGSAFLFTGQRVASQVGIYYYKARFYSPYLGRFLQTDPIGTKDDTNLYGYVRNDPINSKDPNGLDTFFVGGFFDRASGNAVYSEYTTYRDSHIGELVQYFSFDQGGALLSAINSVPLDRPVNVASHSYGADTALKIVGSASRMVDVLFTGDPVARIKADQDKVVQNVGVWVNYHSDSTDTFSDFVAQLGGRYDVPNNPTGFNYRGDLPHNDFGGMLSAHPAGQPSALDIIDFPRRKK